MSQDRPRVLFVDHTAALGGAELCLLDTARGAGEESAVILFEDGPLANRLRDNGVSVHILSASRALGRVRRDGAPPVIAASLGVAALAMRLARFARRYDVIYANTQKAFVVATVAGIVARRPVVWHLHDLLTTEHFGRKQLRVAVGLARRFAAAVVANSGATRDAYIAAGGRPDHVHVVFNGISPVPFDAVRADDVARVRQELGVADAPLVGLFGRLAPWKGQMVLLEALVGMPGVHALLVGDALFDADRAFALSLGELVGTLGLRDRVHALGFRDDVPTLMRACDIVVHASTSPEPFGRVIVEGMLAGRPVIATSAGGAMELIDDGTNGLLVPPGDADALGLAAQRLLGDTGLSDRLAASALRDARARFATETIRSQIGRVLSKVTAER